MVGKHLVLDYTETFLKFGKLPSEEIKITTFASAGPHLMDYTATSQLLLHGRCCAEDEITLFFSNSFQKIVTLYTITKVGLEN